ncbi:MAG: T9SS type A sorting domain-containing protein, partial [Gaiellaceae bacterium]
TGAVGAAEQGASVSIAGDGNTAIVGGFADNANVGAAWVFTRNAGVWSQQGGKLVGTGPFGTAYQGYSVAVSGDGSTALLGAFGDNSSAGATWAFKRRAGVWSQQGVKLVGTGASNPANQGAAVSLSADGNVGIVGGYGDNFLAGAAWLFVNASPTIVGINDVPNDQGGHVNLRWTASLLDNAPGNPIDQYWIWRQVPTLGALHAIESGATLLPNGAALGVPAIGALRATRTSAQVYYWEYVGSQVAHGFPAYSYTAPTTGDSVGGSNPYTLFMVESEQLTNGLYWDSDPDSAYSIDNLAPGPPALAAAIYAGGATHVHWGANGEADFAIYRIYRGPSASFIPGAGNLIASQPDTSYADTGPAGNFYKLSAVDIHGNESAFTLVSPGGTTGVNEGGAAAFALQGARPNPARGRSLNVAFSLPGGAAARLEVFDMNGRRLLSREVGSLDAGWHTVNVAEGRRIAPGVYWVSLTQG